MKLVNVIPSRMMHVCIKKRQFEYNEQRNKLAQNRQKFIMTVDCRRVFRLVAVIAYHKEAKRELMTGCHDTMTHADIF